MTSGDEFEGRFRRIAEGLEKWFEGSQRRLPWRATYEPYHVWVSEVMLQQTRMERVIGYFERFIQRFPDVESLARADPDEVLSPWSGLGYYRRARQLHAGAREVAEVHEGLLPETLSDLLTIPGIGRYTAGAILSIGYDLPAPIVDGNVARVLARLEALTEPLGTSPLARAEWKLAARVVESASSPRMLNQALMELGSMICTPRSPDCARCPVRDECRAFVIGEVERFPVPGAKKVMRELEIPLYAIEDSGGKLLMRLESGPLMTGMYHLPHGNDLLLPGGLLAARETKRIGSFRHSVTNRRIEFTVWRAELDRTSLRERPGDWLWVAPAELEHLPHPSYVIKALQLMSSPRTTPLLPSEH